MPILDVAGHIGVWRMGLFTCTGVVSGLESLLPIRGASSVAVDAVVRRFIYVNPDESSVCKLCRDSRRAASGKSIESSLPRFLIGVSSVYAFPLTRLWCRHNIWQFASLVSPPFDHAVTWSASISLKA